jgi:hypothetical protein
VPQIDLTSTLLGSLVAVATLMASLCSAQSATLTLIRTDTTAAYDCNISLSGKIQDGDSARLQPLMQQVNGMYMYKVICLDSTGGSYNEGLALAQAIRDNDFATRLVAGAHCYSSCALAFMGGAFNSESGMGRLTHRIMSPGARLGFHAPYLDFGRSDFTRQNVQSSYAKATASIARLLSLSTKIDVPSKLIEKMLYQGPDRLYFVETIGDLGQFGIGLHGYKPIENDDNLKFNSCWNLYSWRNGNSIRETFAAFSEDFEEAVESEYIRFKAKDSISGPRGADYVLVPHDFELFCNIKFDAEEQDTSGRIHQVDSYIERELDLSNNLILRAERPAPAWSRLPSDTKLADLPEGSVIDLPEDMLFRF